MKPMPAASADQEHDADSVQTVRSAAAREKILDAALAEFAERGLAGARVDSIASRAGINKRFLYKYVGNKQALWLAVLEQVYARMREGERALHLEDADPEQGMSRLIRFNFRFHAEHPEFLAMLTEENRQRARNLRRSKGVQDLYSPLLQLIEGLLKRGGDDGVFRGGVDPMQLYISIAALSYFYCSNRHTLSTIFARDLGAAHEMLQREDHVVEVILGFLRPERR